MKSQNFYENANRWLVAILRGMRKRVLRENDFPCNYEYQMIPDISLVPNLITSLVKLLKKLLNYLLSK